VIISSESLSIPVGHPLGDWKKSKKKLPIKLALLLRHLVGRA
jgi:hypothetical protein